MELLGLRKVESFVTVDTPLWKKQNLGEHLRFANWAASSRVGRTSLGGMEHCDFCAMAVLSAAGVRDYKLVMAYGK